MTVRSQHGGRAHRGEMVNAGRGVVVQVNDGRIASRCAEEAMTGPPHHYTVRGSSWGPRGPQQQQSMQQLHSSETHAAATVHHAPSGCSMPAGRCNSHFPFRASSSCLPRRSEKDSAYSLSPAAAGRDASGGGRKAEKARELDWMPTPQKRKTDGESEGHLSVLAAATKWCWRRFLLCNYSDRTWRDFPPIIDAW